MSRPWRQATKPRISPDEVKFAEFSGVVNTRSRKDFGLSALVTGDNVVISDSKKITRREGYSVYKGSGNIRSAFGDTGNLYVVAGDTLLRMVSQTVEQTLTTGLTGTQYTWDSINNDAYYANGVEAGIARGDTHLPWRIAAPALSAFVVVNTPTVPATTFNVGQTYTTAKFRVCAAFETADGREGPPSEIAEIDAHPATALLRVTTNFAYARVNIYATEADGTVFRLVASGTSTAYTFNPARGGREFLNLNLQGLPDGVTHVTFCKGRAYVGQFIPAAGYSVVWKSRPFAYHLFNLAKDFIPVTGRIAILIANNKGTLIGTDQFVYQYHDATGELEELCDYGVVPGNACDTDAKGIAYFWTVRGLCRSYPFENLTEQDVSMPPGSRAVAAMLYLNGLQQFVTVTQGGGEAFNSRRERT